MFAFFAAPVYNYNKKRGGTGMRKLANSIGTVDKLERALLSCLNEKAYCDVTISAISPGTSIKFNL